MDPIVMFAQLDRNLVALQSFHSLYQFKKIVEKQFGCKISFDQLGEIVEIIMSNPTSEVFEARLPDILRGG